MKKIFLFAAVFAALTMNAQTIVMDGNNADWADVPMLNEPGVSPVFKMVVPQSGLTLPADAALCVMVERTTDQKTTYSGYPVVFVDADKAKVTTAAADAWYCPAFGPDYEMATWDDGNTFGANEAETIHEMTIVKSNFTTIPFSGECNAWMLFNWEKFLPNSPSDNGWKWSENDYHPIIVKPYAIADLNGTHAASAVYSSHEALMVGSTIDVRGASANDIALWASWVVELKTPAKYAVTANISSTNTASVDLKLVSCATNKVVASLASGDLAEGNEVEVGEWDLSAVPAGKYMLKFSNHVEWSVMQLNSVTLKPKDAPSSIDNTPVEAKAMKVIRDGQVLILRDGKAFNALGAEMK